MKDNKLIIKNDKGIEKEYDILFTFDNTEKGRNYVVYTEYNKDKDGNLVTYSSYYNMNDKSRKLYNIDSKDEIEFVDKMIESIEYNIKNN
jgi:uncharacterized protein YrzB (UPF0473 family)